MQIHPAHAVDTAEFHTFQRPPTAARLAGDCYPDDSRVPSDCAGVVLADDDVWDWVDEHRTAVAEVLELHAAQTERCEDPWLTGEYRLHTSPAALLTLATRVPDSRTAVTTSVLTVTNCNTGAAQ